MRPVRRSSLARRGSFNIRGDAATQCFHEIDHPVRRGKHLLALWNGAGLLGPEVRQQRLLVVIPKVQGACSAIGQETRASLR